jgi:NDP-sugar pyrophosphorylase family protein
VIAAAAAPPAPARHRVPARRPPAGLRLRALVLAAGRGERLRPLTTAIPKALLPVAGEPLIAHTLRALARLGCEAVAINLHHLGDLIRGRLGDHFGPLPLVYSPEPELLGTLGALGALRDFFAGAGLVVVVNGDSLCRWPLRRLVQHHRRAGAAATLLLARQAAPAAFGGGVAVGAGGRILALRGAADPPGTVRRRVFAGAQVLDPALLRDVEARPSDLVSGLYEPLLAAGGAIASLATALPWHDLGTPARYLEAVLDRARRAGAAGGASVVEAGAEIATGARVERSLLLAGARVGAGCRLRETIVGPLEIAAGARLERQMVTPASWGLGPHGTADGERVYTPLGP